ncbi:MAG: diadenylate cyclase [Mycoplasmoidaceae bacterium]|nr:diadenylate cyclase [Mycoplasmoidaceae bacterium]
MITYFVRSPRYARPNTKNTSRIYKNQRKKIINIENIALYIANLATTLSRLGNNKVGSLLIMENKDNLEKYVQLGTKVDSPFFSELVYSIFFNHESALHDGAIIIRNLRIVSLSSYLPLSNRLVPVNYGSRHRAAFGLAERTDALVFIVSETTGLISCVHGSENIALSNDSVKLASQLTDVLFDFYYPLTVAKTPIVIQKIKEKLSQ